MKMLFPFLRPDLPRPEEWVHYLEDAYANRYFSNFGTLATRLANEMSKTYFQPDYQGLLCSSNTSGITAVLQAINVEGKKVAVPDFTFAATPHAIFSAGALPVVCDIDPTTWELSPESLMSAIKQNPDICAVIHVRPFGLIRDISPIRDVCKKHGLPLVVDAAAGLGAPSDGANFGSNYGEVEIFSLHATKVFAVGEGGFIGAPSSMIPKIKATMNFGFNSDRTYSDGLNAKFDEFHAAIGLAMLKKMDDIVPNRKNHSEAYNEIFNAFEGCVTAKDSGPTPWSTYPVIFNKQISTETIGAFADNGIEIKKYYWPGIQRGYKGRKKLISMEIPNSLQIQDRCACFPVYSDYTKTLKSQLQERINSSVSKFICQN